MYCLLRRLATQGLPPEQAMALMEDLDLLLDGELHLSGMMPDHVSLANASKSCNLKPPASEAE